jgi:hypothetical protein
VPDACNVSWWLAKALQRTQNFVSVTGAVDFAAVKAEIDAGRPVGRESDGAVVAGISA